MSRRFAAIVWGPWGADADTATGSMLGSAPDERAGALAKPLPVVVGERLHQRPAPRGADRGPGAHSGPRSSASRARAMRGRGALIGRASEGVMGAGPMNPTTRST
jgi:hypothetical protein